jgi:hypothetical protein
VNDKEGGMGVIVTHEFVCDFCGQEVKRDEALVGALALRRAGARGQSRNFEVALHDGCSAKLTQHADAVRQPKRRS